MGQGSSELRGVRQRVEAMWTSLDAMVHRVRSLEERIRALEGLEEKQARLAKLIVRLEGKVEALENPSGASPTEVKKRVRRRVTAGKKG
jgi:uncharacterized protein (DUF1810 family)